MTYLTPYGKSKHKVLEYLLINKLKHLRWELSISTRRLKCIDTVIVPVDYFCYYTPDSNSNYPDYFGDDNEDHIMDFTSFLQLLITSNRINEIKKGIQYSRV